MKASSFSKMPPDPPKHRPERALKNSRNAEKNVAGMIDWNGCSDRRASV
jgi:hypothetical protein